MPEPPAWIEDGLAGLELGIVEQHVLDRAEGDWGDGRADISDAGRGGDEQAGGQVDQFLRKAVEMKAMHAADIFAQIVALLAAGTAQAAGARAVDGHQLAGDEAACALAERFDHARRLRADDQRQLALGKRHAAPAPDVDMVERDDLDAHA